MLCLEGGGDGQAVGFAGLEEGIPRAVPLENFGICVVTGAALGEHRTRNQLRRAALILATNTKVAVRLLIEPQRIVGVVEAEGGVYDRHDDRELNSCGHARDQVGAGDGVNIALEADQRAGNAALACAVIPHRATIEGCDERVKTLRALLQLPLVEGRVEAKVIKEREGDRA